MFKNCVAMKFMLEILCLYRYSNLHEGYGIKIDLYLSVLEFFRKLVFLKSVQTAVVHYSEPIIAKTHTACH